MSRTPLFQWLAAAAVAGLAVAPLAQADDGRRMPRMFRSVHAGMWCLPHRLSAGLAAGGFLASGDGRPGPALRFQRIARCGQRRPANAWLQAHAGTYKRVREAPPEDRITRSIWFERKHRAIDPATWKLASVKSAANCVACHAGADRGDFDDDNVQMPAGVRVAGRGTDEPPGDGHDTAARPPGHRRTDPDVPLAVRIEFRRCLPTAGSEHGGCRM